MSAYLPGAALLWAAFVFALVSVWAYVGLHRGDETARATARRAYGLFALSIVGASAILMQRILVHDFRIGYVASYSSTDLPLHYLVSTFWAGQEGSFLIWLFFGALVGLPLIRSAREQEAPTMIVYLATLLGLTAILLKQSPFAWIAAPAAPVDGKGLNPLLQDPWMTIHPPVMFVGFASLGVPFAFAIAGLWMRRYDSWIVRSLPWTLVSFVTLGTAILMGGYWAYKTLGWGGYWGWDPVENTSLVPWIAVTALLHGMYAQRKRGRYRRLNFSLAILAFVCILYGTFLTRSGILGDFSVHSFVDLGITGWLVAYLLTFLVAGLALLAWRFREIPTPDVEEPFLSRGVFLLLAIASLLAMGFVILLGTSAPLLTRVAANPSQVSLDFYNLTTSPVAFLLIVLMGFLPYVGWKGTGPRELLRAAAGPLAFAVVAGAVTWLLGIREPLYLAMIVVCYFTFASSLLRYAGHAAKGAVRQGAGFLAHAGLALMMAGIVLSSAFDTSERAVLERNVPVEVMGQELMFRRPVALADGKNGMEVQVADVETRERFLAYPRMYVNSRTQQMMANPHIAHGLFRDLYLTPLEYDPGQAARAGRELVLGKGESATFGPHRLDFVGFELDGTMDDAGHASVSVELRASSGDGGAAQPFAIPYSPAAPRTAIAAVPGAPAGTRVRVETIDASNGRVRLLLVGPADLVGTTPGAPERLSVDLTVKPMINLVWGGFYVLMAGGLLAMIERFRQSLAAQALPPDPEPATASAGGPEAAPDAPAPARA